MSFGINNNRKHHYSQINASEYDPHISSASAILNINGKKVKLLKTSIKKISKKYARIAKKLGSTANEDDFSDEMTEAIFEIFKQVEKEDSDKHR